MKRGIKPRDPMGFFHQSYVVGQNGCWIWTSTINQYGYGILNIGRNGKIIASRLSLQLATGKSGEGLFACHSCDQPACINPEHLFWGTQSDNMRDAAAKGRLHNTFQTAKTHCPQGHEYTEENTFLGSKGERACRICSREYSRRHYYLHHEKQLARKQRYRITLRTA